MKSSKFPQFLFIAIMTVLATVFIPTWSRAAVVTLKASDGGGTSSLNSADQWNNNAAPNATNDYFTTNFFVRTPADAGNLTTTFAGHSLTLSPPSGQGAPMRSILYKGGGAGPDTIIINNLTNAGGVINNGGSGNVGAIFTGNQMTITTNSTIIADQGPATIGYPIVGGDGVSLTNSGSTQSGVHSVTYTGSLSGFTGKLLLVNLNGSLGMVLNLNSGASNLGNPTTPEPDQITIGVGCTLTDNAGLTFNNANAGITLIGNGSIAAAGTTTMAEAITDLTNSVSAHATLTSSGGGTLILSNPNNNYTGGTTISAGILQLGANNAVPVGLVTATGTFDLNTFSDTIDGLAGAGTLETSGGGTPTLTIGAAGGNGTFSGSSSGTLNVLKTGAGTETFSAGYNYNGTTTVAGGTLSLVTSGTLPSPAGDVVVSNGATLSVNIAPGVALPANNLVLAGTNSTLNFIYGSLAANPTSPAINAAASISAPGSNIVISISALGLKPGTFTLIKYTGTALSSLANFALNPPPGVNAMLVNNQGNDSIDIDITSAPNQLAWNGVGGTSWDLVTANWTNLVAGGITIFQQYTNNGIIAGDSVLFDDTLTNDGVNPQPTNVTMNTAFYAFPVVENSTLPYSLSGAAGSSGILGPTSLVKSNSGTWTVLTSNSYTGGTFVYGGTLVINNDNALGTNNGAVQLNGGNLEYIGSTTNNVRPFSLPTTAFIGVSSGNTVQLGGNMTGAAGFNKQDVGTLVLGGKTTTTGSFFAKQGTTTVVTGGSITNSNYDDVGQDTNDVATLNISGGSVSTSSDFNVGDIGQSVGTLNISSGSMIVENLFIASANAASSTASGTVNQTGGTLTELNTATGEFVIGGRGPSAAGVAVYNLSNGTVNARGNIRLGSAATGTLNQYGGTFNANQGINIERFAGGIGTNNLNGGLFATFNVASSTGTGTNAVFNFNGGTLQAQFSPPNPSSGSAWFSGNIQANVLAGGAIIDSSSNNVLMTTPLLAASPNGGLTKLGSGMLTLQNTNSFTGPITNNAGTLVLASTNGSSTYPGAVQINAGTLQITPAAQLQGPTAITTNATLSVAQTGSSTATVGNVTMNGLAALPGATLTATLTGSNVSTVPFINTGTLTLNGTNTMNVSGAPVGVTAILKYSSTAGSGNLTNLILPQGASGFLSNNAPSSTYYVVVTNAGPGLVWTGTNNAAGHTNLWDILNTTNWLVNGKTTWYQQFSVPGDAVTFNDSGSGTVLVSNSVGPANMVISNSVNSYTFSGSGLITGPTGVTKLGTATAFMNLTNNNYSGGTTISNGTLQINNPSAISATGNLVIGSGATFEVAGSSPTSGDLIGSGLVDNNTGQPIMLTLGSSSGGTWNGTITNFGGGGFALTKNGSGTWIVGGSNYLNNGQPFSYQNFVAGGTVILTNGGVISIPTLELRIADGTNASGASSSVIVAGGTLIVTNNPLSVGINSNNASGTLVVNSGTVIAGTGGGGLFAESPNYIVVGASGATGVLTVNGGHVIDGQNLWLGQNGGASGTLNLNGGVLQVAAIGNGATAGGASPALSVAYFNGGTLQAGTNSTDFLDGAVTYSNLAGGLVLDDGGWTLSIAAGIGGSGGVTKTDTGTVYIDGGNSYTGTTLVNGGTLAGVGTIAGPVVVASAGTLGVGDASAGAGQTININNNLTLQGTTVFRISFNNLSPANDQINEITNANYGGTLVVSNVTVDSSALTNGQTFQLFNAQSGIGNFAHIVGSPGAGLSYVFYPSTGVLGVTNVVVKSIPRITHISVSGTTLNLSGTNGTVNSPYVLLGSTNVALSLTNWTPLLTNQFDGSGNFNLSTNIIVPGAPLEFYLLSQ